MIVPKEFTERRAQAEIMLCNRLLHWSSTHQSDPLQEIDGIVDIDDFADPFLRAVFFHACQLYAKGRYSIRALYQSFEDFGGKYDLQSAFKGLDEGYIFEPLNSLANDVRMYANKARLSEVVDTVEKRISDLSFDVDTWEAFLEAELTNAVRRGSREKQACELSEGVDDWIGRLERNEGRPGGLSTGISALDEQIGGVRGGDLIIVGGRPSMGKTIMGTTMLRACAEAGLGAMMFSLEMPRDQLRARILCDMARDRHKIQYREMLSNRLSATDIAELRGAADMLKHYAIQVDDRGGLSAEQITYGARRAERAFAADGKKLGLIVVDYLQLMSLSKEWRGDRNNGVGANSAALKKLAKELDCPIVVLSQLSREVERRDNKRPTMADLRDSGSIEQDADVILFPFREEYYLQKEAGEAKKESARIELMADLAAVKQRIEIIVEKQRNGPRGVVKADCDASTSSIRDYGAIRQAESADLFTGAAA